MNTRIHQGSALAGRAREEIVTLPAPAELDHWTTFENARKARSPQLSRSVPALRYLEA
ncbi:hypothetical protein [Pseudomonas sp. Irchel 3A7]|uniref:hypothetical protein n=1 Tax=Pseudomonas sp. Irchel 3A7 TaxID=2008913 RepID=UPI00148221B3|nr:hypothetical protein [Pseudomonas sp. Irchel 3A7]